MLILSDIGVLYDGTGAGDSAVHRHVDLFVDGGLIHEVKLHDPALAVGEAHTKVDASAWSVVPGLIDCHSHLTVLGLDGGSIDLMNTGEMLVWVEKILHTTLVDGGVTTARDVGGATHLMKRLVEEGTVLGPRLKISIGMLSTTGGHADFRGPDRCHGELSRLWPEGPGRPGSIVDGPWECRQRVRELAACGADLIKICASPGVASPGDKLEHREFTPEEIEAICDEADGRGMQVAAHAHSQSGIELAIQHGVHDIQHISYMDERLVELAAENRCVVTPTSWVIDELTRAEGLSDFVMQKVWQVREVHADAVNYAAKGGLPILMGTDPVLPGMHGRNALEISALIREGLSPLQAWHGTTGLAAEHIEQPDTGTLVAGQRADFLVCTADDVIEHPEKLVDGALLEVVKDGEGYRGGVPEIPQRRYDTGLRERLAKR